VTDNFTKALRRTNQIEETLKTAKVDVVETPFLTIMRTAIPMKPKPRPSKPGSGKKKC